MHVVALAVHIDDGRKVWEQAGRTRTDEDGEFRISNLTPGTYYLEAGPKLRSSFLNARSATRQLGFAAYYAGTPVRESATAIELGPGQQFEAEVSLKPEPLCHITGAISGLSDRQGTGVQVVNRYGEAVPVPVRIEQETGQFQMNVPAGSYLLRANTWGEGGLSSSAELPLAISSDMDGLQMAVLPPHPIPVMVKLEPVHRHRRSELEPTQLVSFRLRPAEFAVPAPEYSVNVEKIQGRPSLVMRNLPPGKYSVEFQPAADWYVQQAQCGSTDLLNDQLAILAGARTPPIEIVLRDDGASIKGTVAMGKGRKRAGVFVVSARAAEKTKMVWTSPEGDFAASKMTLASKRQTR